MSDEKVQAAVRKLGLEATSSAEDEWHVHSGSVYIGKLLHFPKAAEKALWLTVPGAVHESPEDALKDLAQLTREMVFTVRVRLDVTPDGDSQAQVAQAVNEAMAGVREKVAHVTEVVVRDWGAGPL